MLPIAMVTYDRRGDPYHSFDGAYGIYESGDRKFMDGKHPYWSLAHFHAFDIQTGRMTRMAQVKSITGGHAKSINDTGIYHRYMTKLTERPRIGRGVDM